MYKTRFVIQLPPDKSISKSLVIELDMLLSERCADLSCVLIPQKHYDVPDDFENDVNTIAGYVSADISQHPGNMRSFYLAPRTYTYPSGKKQFQVSALIVACATKDKLLDIDVRTVKGGTPDYIRLSMREEAEKARARLLKQQPNPSELVVISRLRNAAHESYEHAVCLSGGTKLN